MYVDQAPKSGLDATTLERTINFDSSTERLWDALIIDGA
jgi:hypothetical protein